MFKWFRNLITGQPLAYDHRLSFLIGGEADGRAIDEQTLLSMAPTYSAVRAISEAATQLPLVLLQRNQSTGHVEEVHGHPLCDLICTGGSGPNLYQTPNEFLELMIARSVIWNNAIAFVERSARRDGEVTSIKPVHPNQVDIDFDDKAGVILYNITYLEGVRVERLNMTQVLHIRGFTRDGFRGEPLSETLAGAIKSARFVETAALTSLEKGLRVAGFIKRGKQLTKDQKDELEKEVAKISGAWEQGTVPIVPHDFEWESVGMSNLEAELLAARKFAVTNQARYMNVPPNVIGDLEHATFSNIVEQNRQFLDRTVTPWLTRFQARLGKTLLKKSERIKGMFFRFDTNYFLRSNLKDRYLAVSKAVGGPFMTINEARKMEDLNPVEGGDEVLKPANMLNPGGDPDQTDDPDENSKKDSENGSD